jgi:hypothetical protein
MSDRLPSTVLVNALLRRVNDAGGMAMVLAKGDLQAGAILIITCRNGCNFRILERGIGPSGRVELVASTALPTDDSAQVAIYWQRRRARDPDLWVIELDSPEAERFAAETIAIA